MNKKDCIKVKCEFLAITHMTQEDWCLDCNSELFRVSNCGIIEGVRQIRKGAK